MSGPRFTILAQLDELHFVAACRHGVVHLTWDNITLRLTLDEFKALAHLVERITTERTPVVMTDDPAPQAPETVWWSAYPGPRTP